MTERYDEVENQFGIKAYASPELSGFAAVLKGRFSDFSVREGEQYQPFLYISEIDGHMYNSC